MGGCYGDAVEVRPLFRQVFVGELAAVFVDCDHAVPVTTQWLLTSNRNRLTGHQRWLPPPVAEVEVVAMIDHAERVVQVRVDQPAAGSVWRYALQTLGA